MSKVWFVTGANSGIGAGIVATVLDSGGSVVATGRNMDKLRAAFAGVENERLALVQLDVTDKAQAEKAIGDAVARFGRLDVVVNNAGIAVLGYFEALSASDFERQLAPNLYGVINVLHAALPVMRKQRAGHIINISSVAGGVGQMHAAAYSASKFAVEGLSMALADEVAKFGINVTVVSRISSAASCWIRAMPASSIPVSRITPPAPRPAKHGRPMTASRTAIR